MYESLDYWTLLECYWQRRNREIEKQPVRAPLCSPKIPHALARERTWPPRGKWPATDCDMARRPWIVEPCGRSSVFRSNMMPPPSGYIVSSEMSLTATTIYGIIWVYTKTRIDLTAHYVVWPVCWNTWRYEILWICHGDALDTTTFTSHSMKLKIKIPQKYPETATRCITYQRISPSTQRSLKWTAKRQWARQPRPWTKLQDTMEYYLAAT